MWIIKFNGWDVKCPPTLEWTLCTELMTAKMFLFFFYSPLKTAIMGACVHSGRWTHPDGSPKAKGLTSLCNRLPLLVRLCLRAQHQRGALLSPRDACVDEFNTRPPDPGRPFAARRDVSSAARPRTDKHHGEQKGSASHIRSISGGGRRPQSVQTLVFLSAYCGFAKGGLVWTDVITVIGSPEHWLVQGWMTCLGTESSRVHQNTHTAQIHITSNLSVKVDGMLFGGSDDSLSRWGDALFNEVSHQTLQVRLQKFCSHGDVSTSS